MKQPHMGLSIRAGVETPADNHRLDVTCVGDTEPIEAGLVIRFESLLKVFSSSVHFVGLIDDIKDISASEEEPRHNKGRDLEYPC